MLILLFIEIFCVGSCFQRHDLWICVFCFFPGVVHFSVMEGRGRGPKRTLWTARAPLITPPLAACATKSLCPCHAQPVEVAQGHPGQDQGPQAAGRPTQQKAAASPVPNHRGQLYSWLGHFDALDSVVLQVVRMYGRGVGCLQLRMTKFW